MFLLLILLLILLLFLIFILLLILLSSGLRLSWLAPNPTRQPARGDIFPTAGNRPRRAGRIRRPRKPFATEAPLPITITLPGVAMWEALPHG